MSETAYDGVVIGGGVIGLSIAWRAAARGIRVAVVDPAPGSGASYASAGMLAPVTEATYGEEPLLRLGLASAQRYPAFVAELEEVSGEVTGYRTEGTLDVAFDTDDLAVLDDLRRFQESLGMRTERLTSRECRTLEPMLAPAVRGGILVGGDHSINPRRLSRALLVAVERVGVSVRRERAEALLVERDEAVGVRLADGAEVRAPRVVLAAGCWSSRLEGVPPEAVPPVRPVKGQILRLWTPYPFIAHSVRGVVRGSSMYLVPRAIGSTPRAGGEIVLGATSEELGYDTRVTVGGVWELLRDGHELLPGITELELTETHAGLRPGSPDNAPMLGATTLPGLAVATGHYRNGVLLTPVTAEVMAEVLASGRMPEVGAPFSPRRFAHRDEREGAHA